MNNSKSLNSFSIVMLILAVIALAAVLFYQNEQQAKQTLIKNTETSHCQIVKQGLLCKEVSERAWLETI